MKMMQTIPGPLANLGRPVRHPDVCSKCGDEIADDHVPLIRWSDKRMWCYCHRCEPVVVELLGPAAISAQ
jgi:hypothetical protein